jgi:peptidoglycan-associated lipoprotein
MKLRPTMLFVMVVGVVVGACSRRQPPPQPEPERQTPGTVTQTGPDTAAIRRAAEAEAARTRAEETARARAILEEMVFFDYDDSRIRSDQQETLNRKVAVLRANAAVALRITGHADERGSLEYNLALGLRRANSVRDYLSGFGLDATRLGVDSMGEDRPLDPGHDESAWSKNRRAEFAITRGGENLVTRSDR